MTTPSLYRTRIRHTRHAPIRHGFEYRSYSWFVDLDDLPRLPLWLRPFARFDPADHFDRPLDPETFADRRHVLYRLRREDWRARRSVPAS